MREFCDSVHVMNDTREAIRDEIVSWSDSKTTCLIGPESVGRVPVYPNVQDSEAFACRLSASRHKIVLRINLHDKGKKYCTP